MTLYQSTIKRLCAIALAAAILAIPLSGRAAFDKKYYKKMADKVWSMNLPQFDTKADLSDSLFSDKSAVIIAKYIGLSAKYSDGVNERKYSLTGIPQENAITAFYLKRIMVKLNDASSIEKFGEFEIEPFDKLNVRGFTLYTQKPAFGARIFKPDGTVRNVNLQEVFTVKEGKKDKNEKSYKLAVPGLEVGDVLEYFLSSEVYADEMSMKGITVGLLSDYPIRDLKIDCRIAPQLAFEYGVYNGAPDFERYGKDSDGLMHCDIHLQNVNGMEESMPFFREARQMPYLSMNVLNNQAGLEFVPKNPRPAGLRKMTYPFLVQDASMRIISTELPAKLESTALSIAKDWLKAHPEASGREKSDAIWMAVRYAANKHKENINGRQCCVAFCNVIEKLGFPEPGRIGITTSRQEVPVSQLASYRDADYIAVCGNAIYFPGYDIVTAPGEVPHDYCGEEFVKFNASPSDPLLHTFAQKDKIATSNAKENKSVQELTLKIDPTNPDNASIDTKATFTGTCKTLSALSNDKKDWEKEYERYLGLKAKEKFTPTPNNPDQKELFETLAKSAWGSEEANVTSYAVNTLGVTPDSKVWEIEMSGTVPGLVSEAGNGLMVKVGQLIGEQMEIAGTNRERSISAILSSAKHELVKIRFEIPEGYQVTQESIDNLKRNVMLQEGQFYVNATVEDKAVVLGVSKRFSNAIYSADSWQNILKICDAAFDFQNASLVIKPV